MLGMRVVVICSYFGVALCAPALAADKPALSVKPGLWEMTYDGEASGRPPIPAEALARMSPEQRAQLEARLQQMAMPRHEVRQQCMTQNTLDRGFGRMQQMGGGDCMRTVTTNSPTLLEGHVQCRGAANGSGSYRFEALTPEAVVGFSDMTMSDGARTMRVRYNIAGKWVSASCGSVAPQD